MMLISFSQLLLPDGGLKKFASLAAGFMIISAVISPLDSVPTDALGDFSLPGEGSSAANEALYRAEVIKRHRENLAEIIEKKFRHKSRAYVDTDNDGNITKITLHCGGDESGCIAYIIRELGVPRERIVTVYENN